LLAVIPLRNRPQVTDDPAVDFTAAEVRQFRVHVETGFALLAEYSAFRLV